jgi:hypothetical protein
MSLQPTWLMPGLVTASMFLAGAVGAIAAPAPALADGVRPVTVEGRAPTSVAVSIVGKTRHQVLQDIRGAAYVVCRNAYLNGDLGAYDYAYGRCPDRATDAAYDRYVAILRSDPAMTVAALTITPNTPHP